MAATIVYDGVQGDGNLFAGTKFFLLQQIPDRKRWEGLVKANGGEVVKIDKQADIIIADHARKYPPQGSISWTYIDASVKNGELADIEDHRAGPVTKQVREVGSGQPTRKGKTPFTAEDDKILMDWCLRAERKGISLKGNDLYKQLEAKNSRHTFQSWRDRWIKYVSLRSRPEPPENEDEDEDDAGEDSRPAYSSPQVRSTQNRGQRSALRAEAAATAPPPPAARLAPGLPTGPSAVSPAHSKKSQESPIPGSLTAPPFISKSTGGNEFTDEETQILFDRYEDIMNLDDDQVIDAWIAWSKMYPNHTAQEWRNCFKEYIIPTRQAQIETTKSERASKKMLPSEPLPSMAISKPSPSRREDGSAPEIKDSQGSSGNTSQSQNTAKKIFDPLLTNPKLFNKSLLELAEELRLEVDFNPVICGRAVPLFKLWCIVQQEEFGGFDAVTGRKLWSKVASKLNFNNFQHADAAKDLMDCYGEILADLESVRNEWLEQEDLTGSQEDALVEEQLLGITARESQAQDGDEAQYSDEEEHNGDLSEEEDHEDELLNEQEEHDDDLNYAQFSPRNPQLPSSSSGKRSFGADRTNQDIPYNKRQRIDKGKGKELEIPSTPEDVINSNQTSRPTPQFSAIESGQTAPSDDPSIKELDIRPINFDLLKPREPPQPRNLEPETQDFNFSLPQEEEKLEEEEEEDYDDDDEESLFVKQSPSPVRTRIPHRNSGSIAATRGTLHSSSANNYESSTQSQTESQNQAEIAAFINKHVEDGYAQEIVIEALEATSMVIKEAEKVMDSLADGEGIPEDIPGVWTSWDDEALDAGRGTVEYEHVVRKHGISRIGVRKKYLRDAREAAEEGEIAVGRDGDA